MFLKGVYFFLAESKAVLGASALSMALGTCSDGHATGSVCPGPYPAGHSRVGLWKVEIQGSNTLAWQVLTSQEPNPKQPKCSRGRISREDLKQRLAATRSAVPILPMPSAEQLASLILFR